MKGRTQGKKKALFQKIAQKNTMFKNILWRIRFDVWQN